VGTEIEQGSALAMKNKSEKACALVLMCRMRIIRQKTKTSDLTSALRRRIYLRIAGSPKAPARLWELRWARRPRDI
jgi:hypothetical protein